MAKAGDILLAQLRDKAARRDAILGLLLALLQPDLTRLELELYARELRN